MQTLETDILILGAGGAGLFAALHAKKANPDLDVTIAVKGLLGKCGCTRMVQGGYNVALAANDSVERHFMDTIEGGAWLNHQKLAWQLVETAPIRIRELENDLGCFFDRNPDGTVHQKAFAGQTFDRTVHKGDLTGIEIINRLAEQVWRRNIKRLEDHRALDLIPTPEGDLAGVLMLDMRTGEPTFVRARATLLATGGGPTMYRYHTPSGDKTCDGMAMALRAGLPLRDMEMVQFHPTGLLAGEGTRMTGTVLEEGLRGSGGYLVDSTGERFMFEYDQRGERATRDIVSRSIMRRIREGYASPNGGVYIRMAHLGPERVRREFKGMVERCADCGFDLAGGQVEVIPTAHYMMGGVQFAPDCATAMYGLYAAGEDTGGVHGANRLGGNGVANSTVYGGIAGDRMGARVKPGSPLPPPNRFALNEAHERAFAALGLPGGDLEGIRRELQSVMWDDVGILRTAEGLDRAAYTLQRLSADIAAIGVPAPEPRYNLTWMDRINIENMILVSRAICAAALARTDSRGAHFREDFPERGSLEDSRYTVAKLFDDDIRVTTEAVRFTHVRPGETLIQDAAE
ncbi:fumarate reductase flavoprotein subunit [Variibacter gotjawalensis]|uniref:Fumarate reductase flavoprotein subunit n=1 Tax=Variibacter gotjawalensis TaxID=1333996 RepID=A0A0S3PNX8_9BRAD|nr:FAD-binding protein [Variibacter gotjawalensis]NIK47929.1 fumarate reductase flavoprotein subunit [Variibacter gotjawalensis]RZS49807.1 fumarate reductase flavoprotein subunit [Variibacter gotjawalensis]BAT57636.1 fumarate reductase flavoprotein subunit [Variibacter gotjawalensis]